MSDCCTNQGTAAPFTCPKTGDSGKAVEIRLVYMMVLGRHHALIDGQQSYRLCEDGDCDVVYFGSGGSLILKEHLAEQIGIKEFGKASDYPICHCFHFSRSDVESEIERSGTSTIGQRISAYIKQKLCACEVRNPTGQCCLGFVNKVTKDVKSKK